MADINVKLLQGTETTMSGDSAPSIKNGQLYFATIDDGTKGYIYLDSNGKRFSFGKYSESAGYATESGYAGTAGKAKTANSAKNGIYYIEGTSTTEGVWTGKHSEITEYYNGLTIAYKVNIAGSSTTTLAIGDLEAVTVVRNATTKVTTHYPVGSIIILIYTVDSSGTAYWKVADYDANSYAYTRQYLTTADTEYPLLFRYKTNAPTNDAKYVTEYTRYAAGITVNPDSGTITATQFSGNASTATIAESAKEFTTDATIELTGDATGKVSSAHGWSIPVTVNTATKLRNARKFDGVSFTGEADVNRYAVCSTAGGTVAKTASITAGTFNLVKGAKVTIKFTNANTVANPTLNVNGTGAKQIYVGGSALTEAQWWSAGAIIDFVYDEEFWVITSGAGGKSSGYWANVPTSHLSNENTKPTFNPEFKVYMPTNSIISGSANNLGWGSPIPKYLWHDIFSFGANGYPTVQVSSNAGSTWTTSTNAAYTHQPFIQKENIATTVINDSQTAIRWTWTSSNFHACQAAFLNIGFTYVNPVATFDIKLETSTDNSTWTTAFTTTGAKYVQTPMWFYVNSGWSNVVYVRLTLTRTSSSGSVGVSAIKLLTKRWGNQGLGSEYEKPYNWDYSQNIFPKTNNTSTLGTSTYKWSNIYATTFVGDLDGNATSADQATSAGKANEFTSAATIKLTGDATGEASSKHGWTIDVDVNHATEADSADKWTTARDFTITDSDGTNTGAAVSVDGSANAVLKLPSIIKATLNGNANSATKAYHTLNTKAKYSLSGTNLTVSGNGDIIFDTGIYTDTTPGHLIVTGGLDNTGVLTQSAGHVYLTGANASSSTNGKTQLVFGTSSDNHVAISSNTHALVLNPTTSSTTNQIVLYLDQASKFPSGLIAGNSITPVTSGQTTLGTSSSKFSNLYLSGDASIGGGASVGGNLTVTNNTILNGTLTVKNNASINSSTTTPYDFTTNLYMVNKKLSWNTGSYLQNVILLIPVLTSTNWSGYNYIDGKFLCWKTGGNVYDTVEISLNCVYNNLRYHIQAFGDHASSWKLCICKYNGVAYYALKCPYHANPYTNVEFIGHTKSVLPGGTHPSSGTGVALPLGIAYYNENTQTVLNSEVNSSLTDTLTTSIVTSATSSKLYSIGGFQGNITGNITGNVTGNLTGNVIVTSYIKPQTTNTVSLGDSTYKFKDLYLAGNASIGVDATVGGSLTVNQTTSLKGNTTIGDAAADTLTVNATPTFNQVITASGGVKGNVTGNLTGDVKGNVTGNLTGDVTGDVTGNLTGDVTGNVSGSAGKLASEFGIRTNLASEDFAYTDGTKVAKPGVEGVLPVAHGGTGVATFTAGAALIGNGTGAIATRAITNNTSKKAVAASTNLITANTLYYHSGNSNLTTVGTITSGTWHGSTLEVKYGGTGVTSLQANTVVFVETDSNSVQTFKNSKHYVNSSKMAINSTTAPTKEFYVEGNAEASGTITVGSNVTLEYNSTKKSLDFIFA